VGIRRRSQNDFTSWARISRLLLDDLGIPRILHLWRLPYKVDAASDIIYQRIILNANSLLAPVLKVRLRIICQLVNEVVDFDG
jgi:hypothetical protein